VGIALPEDEVLEQIRTLGYQTVDNRVLIPRASVQDFLEAERNRNGNRFSVDAPIPSGDGSSIELYVSPSPSYVHDVSTDRIVPFTMERLIEAAKLVDVLSSRNVECGSPGCPCDVQAELQSVVEYWVAANYSRGGRRPVSPRSVESIPYVMDMAEALGHPLKNLTVYAVSPLGLGGPSLRRVLLFKDRITSANVGTMSSLGCATSIFPGDAYAVCCAEVIGGAILVGGLTGLPVTWHVRICPIDLRTMAMSLGSPEDYLLQLTNTEVNAYFHGTAWHPAGARLHSNAKLPGPQACAEKASLMTAGALLGARWFGNAGELSLDEIFSPEQLLYDIEIRDHAERLVEGIDGECDPDRCLQDLLESLPQRNFAGLGSTRDTYRQFYWHPTLFERDFWMAWEKEGAPTIRARAHSMIPELISQHEYELEPELRRELDRILAKAKQELSS
jgi:trimethylamine:corrinoid methyltransferase-like protein